MKKQMLFHAELWLLLGLITFIFTESSCAIRSSNCVDNRSKEAEVETFGAGSGNGASLAASRTDYLYGSIGRGHYLLTNQSGINGGNWHRSEDFTPGDVDGYMLLIDSGNKAMKILDWPYQNLCSSTNYRFSLQAANLVKPNRCGGSGGIAPILRIEVVDNNGASLRTKVQRLTVQEELSWQEIPLEFVTTANTSSISVHLSNDARLGCGGDFVIDELRLEKTHQ
ncbi:MAG: hypothetical protein AAF433_18675 [Bacteroidota bacterium]